MNYCLECKTPLIKRSQKYYCSNKCQTTAQYKKYIHEWKHRRVDGNRGIVTKNISGHLKRYLVEKYGDQCSLCGWNKKHEKTGTTPLEIDHTDGNSENNTEKNLRLLCPNCHALTPNFKNFNKGNGRVWRKEKYTRAEK